MNALLSQLLAFVGADPPVARLSANRFDCKNCGPSVAVDEDGCCRVCGVDAMAICAWPKRNRGQKAERRQRRIEMQRESRRRNRGRS